MDCIFCKIAKKEIPAHIVGESKDFVCFLDIKPISKGHALIVPRRHCKDLSDFPLLQAQGLVEFTQQMAKLIVPALGADGYNIGMNNGEAAGQVVLHQHTHLIPRYIGDGLKSWPNRDVAPEKLVRVKKIILGEPLEE